MSNIDSIDIEHELDYQLAQVVMGVRYDCSIQEVWGDSKMNRIDWCFWDYDYIKERVRDFYDVETFIDKYSSGSETTENV